jgi:hypothetical protein
MTVTKTKRISRLQALLLGGDDIDRERSRSALTDAGPPSSKQAVRRGETRRLAIAIRTAVNELDEKKRQLAALVRTVAPALLDRTGIGPVSAA